MNFLNLTKTNNVELLVMTAGRINNDCNLSYWGETYQPIDQEQNLRNLLIRFTILTPTRWVKRFLNSLTLMVNKNLAYWVWYDMNLLILFCVLSKTPRIFNFFSSLSSLEFIFLIFPPIFLNPCTLSSD